MKLIKATTTDLGALQAICTEAYRLNFQDHWNEGGIEWYLEREFSTSRLSKDLLNTSITYFFIRYKDENVGFIKVKTNASLGIYTENTAELEKIYVLPNCKGLGIGKFALSQIISILKEENNKHLFLAVIDTNKGAIAFYSKMGFKYHSNTILDIPFFKEELKGMHVLVKSL